jgi:hypothetical protein
MTNGMPFPEFLVVGFVGARRLQGPDEKGRISEREARLASQLNNVLDRLQAELATRENLVAYSALAAGSDTVFAEVIAARNIPHKVVLPTPADSFFIVADFGSVESMARSQALLAGPNVIARTVASQSPQRRTRFSECGFEVANGSDLLIAVHDPSAPERPGGTKETVKFAQSLGKRIIEINIIGDMPVSETAEISWNSETTNGALEEILSTSEAEFDDGATYLPAVAALKKKTSSLSRSAKVHFHYTATLVLSAHVAATLIATVSLAYLRPDLQIPLILVKICLLLLGLGLPLYLFFFSPQRHWATARMCAELCRSVLAMRGFPGPLIYLNSLRLPELDRLTDSLQILHLSASRSHPLGVAEFAALYEQNRIDPEISFYMSKAAVARAMLRTLECLFYIFTILAVLNAFWHLGHLLNKYTIPDSIEAATRVAPVLLPMLAVASASLISTLDLDRRIERYQSMATFLSKERGCLRACTGNLTSGSGIFLDKTVNRIEQALLQETVEWYSKHTYVRGH